MYNKRLNQAFRLSKRLVAGLGLTLFILASQLVRPATIASADTTVCGPVSTNSTWTQAGNDYIVSCDVQVVSGVTLTIQPGVTVKFDADASLQVDGTLIAQGSTFTSNNPSPAQGDWGRIHFTPTSVDAVFDSNDDYVSGSIIQDSLIEWGGGGTGVNGSVETNLASPFIDSNTIRNSWTSGIHALGRSAAQPVVIISNSVSGNKGVFVGGGIHATNGDVISNTVSSNGWAGVDGGGIYASASTLTGNFVSANTCNSGCGIYAIGSTLIGNTVSGNSGDDSGGGVYALSSTVKDNLISGNNVTGGFSPHPGGGIYAVGISMITGNTVSGNSATGNGGGIYVDGGTVSGNTVSGNSTAAEGGGIYALKATVSENIVEENSAASGGGIYGQDANITSNTVSKSNASGGGGGIYAEGQTTVMNNDVSNNLSAQGGGIYSASSFSGVPTLSGNTVQDNEANLGGGIYSVESIANGNTINNNTAQSDGGGIFGEGGTMTNNTISVNSVPSWGHGSGAYLVDMADFSYNDVLTNTASGGTAGGISTEGQPQVQYNNLYGNQPYDAEVVSTGVVTATLNYWGTSPCNMIPSQIYDGDDVPGRGELLYAPSLYSPSPVAQLAGPADLSIITGTSSVSLSWTPMPTIPNIGCRSPGSSAPDKGYLVYYSNASSCPPYDGKGLDQGDSPIDVGQATSITLSGLSKKGYYFVVTGYDYLGRESTFTNEVARPSEVKEIYLPMITH